MEVCEWRGSNFGFFLGLSPYSETASPTPYTLTYILILYKATLHCLCPNFFFLTSLFLCCVYVSYMHARMSVCVCAHAHMSEEYIEYFPLLLSAFFPLRQSFSFSLVLILHSCYCCCCDYY